ncbi:hypothetical protein TNCV_729831 [Trichonephila clavipes]|nr:hypothetical protein TNCV_729831 [Trichonephila clavipes]
MTDGVGTLNQELQYGFSLPSPSAGLTLSSNDRTPDLRSTEGVVLNLFRTVDDSLFHSIDVTFTSRVKRWTTRFIPGHKSETESHCHPDEKIELREDLKSRRGLAVSLK